MIPNHSDSLIHNSTEKRATLPSVLSACLRACNLLTLSDDLSDARRAELERRIVEYRQSVSASF